MEAIVILGAAVWASGPSPTLVRRTRHGAALWRLRPEALIVVCGGLGRHPPSEAAVMRDLLLAEAVPPDRILTEDRSTNTLENIRFAEPLLRASGIDRVTLVTDRTHAPRARMIARHFGLNARTDCPPLKGGRRTAQIKQALREAIALPVYAVRLRLLEKGPAAAGD